MGVIITDEDDATVPESELDKLCLNCYSPLRSHEDYCVYSPKWTPAEFDEDEPADVITARAGRLR